MSARASQFAHYLEIKEEEWLVHQAAPEDQIKMQDTIWERIRLPHEDATLDDHPGGRRAAWRKVLNRKNAEVDKYLKRQGDKATLLEARIKSRKVMDARARKKAEVTSEVTTMPATNVKPMLEFCLPAEHSIYGAVDRETAMLEQQSMYKDLSKLKVTEMAGSTMTWKLTLPMDAILKLGAWFAEVQTKRISMSTVKVLVGGQEVDGYNGYRRALHLPDELQRRVTVKLWAEELIAFRSMESFRQLESAVVQEVTRITGLPELEVVRAHFLDQEYSHSGSERMRERGAAQAGFKLHTDKIKELDKKDEHRVNSVLFTVVVRIGGSAADSALQVLGFPAASMPHAGANHMFPSCMWHYTSQLGGHKLAMFVGYPYPNVLDKRIASLQRWV